MAIYFVDYENVHDEGLKGVSSLNSNDRLVIFYSNNIKNIPFDLHVEISKSKVETEYIKTSKTGKNYLDFQLASYLGFCIGKGDTDCVYIISKDTGYDSVVDLWKSKGYKAERKASIKAIDVKGTRNSQNKKVKPKKSGIKDTEADDTKNNSKNNNDKITEAKSKKYEFPESYRKKVRQAIKSDEVVSSKYSSIYRFIANAVDAEEYDNNLKAVFGKDKGQILYEHTIHILTEFVNSKANTQ